MVWMFPGLTDIPDSCLYDDVTGVILAGGRGRRMGMVDKGLQLLKGKPMVEHVIDRLRPQVSTLMINANRNTEAYATFDYPVYADDPMDFSGPLAGFLTGLRHCKTLYLVTAPCDAPFLSRHLVEDLYRALDGKRADLAVAVSRADEYCQIQPVFCLMKASLASHLENYLKNGGHKIDEWYASLNVATASFDDLHAFENVNTPDELKRLQDLPDNDTGR
ncbi:molybdenum cofactor guanylyltransferase [Oxalobacter aliiformigenes]|uniref:molybdenum cofactor guanylyltransferase MobA n=1 Tax=Oxalobacter aliiformigenes TaxID=2946593 RepID=UPI0022AEE7A7|nr:molybdenum cofactor guanylyltransferase MobA [Oxalobacter aliiformigenes]WAV88621.1 molybdenum cofactor guanylyltransferase [Oxalobacter aliiformigenes]